MYDEIAFVFFRSAQTNTSTGIQQGNTGILMATNRFQYYIRDNEFTNIGTCINIPIAAGSFSTISGGNQNGIFADRILISQNTIAIGTSTNNYVNYGVNISWQNKVIPKISNDYSVSPYTKGILIDDNTLSDVFRGIYVNGNTQILTRVQNNTITLTADNSFTAAQHGIDFSNTDGGADENPTGMIVNGNTLGSPGASASEALVFCGTNIGLYSPSVTCNTLTGGYNGFVFDNTNSLTQWMDNEMQPMVNGLVYTNNGIIGTQGSTYTAINNRWTGNWSLLNHTNLDNSCDASQSILWIKNSASTSPVNNIGPSSSDYDIAGNIMITSTGWDFTCGGEPTNKIIRVPNEDEYPDAADDQQLYMDGFILYRFLYLNDSLRENVPELTDFYNDFEETSMGYFVQIEAAIAEADYSNVRSLISSVIATNTIEQKFIDYYRLYANYLEALSNEESLSAEDSTSLAALALDCPGQYGPAIYQARALFNHIYAFTLPFNDCTQPLLRLSAPGEYNNSRNHQQMEEMKDFNLEVYPNPFSKILQVKVTSKTNYNITVVDVVGNKRFFKEIKKEVETTNLILDLPVGIYFLVVSSQNGIKSIKKIIHVGE